MMRRLALLAASARGAAPVVRAPPASPLQPFMVRGRQILVKRDDRYALPGALSGVAGNKARKLYALADRGFGNAKAVASLGGHQSNAFPCIAALCQAQNLPFYFVCKPVPRWLRSNPAGNYARALALGAELVPLKAADYRRCITDDVWRKEFLADVAGLEPVAWVPQGAASRDAEPGVQMLAAELGADLAPYPGCRVVVPAGTGTTALFLARHMREYDVEVCAAPCATGAAELQRQMVVLDAASGNVGVFPTVLEPSPYRFGAPDARVLATWRELAAAGLHVDLVYAPAAFDALFATCDDRPQCYVHSGGNAGVATQLNRYRQAGLVGAGEGE